MPEKMHKLSFVIPCYGSEETIADVVEEIKSVVKWRKDYTYEIICVNDCSPDHVYEVLKRMAAEDPEIKVINLAKNMGKHSAMMAGYAHAKGEVIVNLDDDGQCPMDHLWELVDALGDDYDVAMAKYPTVKQSKFKNFGSRVNSWMTHVLLNKPKDLYFSNFSVFKRFVVEEILRYTNAFPYLEGLVLRTTNRIINIEMEERERAAGEGNYTFRKSLALFVNGFTAFSVKPLRMAVYSGLVCACGGFLFGLFIVVRKMLNPDILIGYSSLMAALLFIGGMIMMILGLIGEYVGRIYISINNSPQYVVRNTINVREGQEDEQMPGE